MLKLEVTIFIFFQKNPMSSFGRSFIGDLKEEKKGREKQFFYFVNRL